MKKKTIFSDADIVDFCRATMDTNEIHDPDFMEKLGKRVIVPGMYAFSCAAALDTVFLKNETSYIKILFSSLLSSGDFVNLSAEPVVASVKTVRLSAFNHKDTLSLQEEYSRMEGQGHSIPTGFSGILHRLPVGQEQVETFSRLISVRDRDVTNFLFAVSYASRALLESTDAPSTEVEKEICSFIGGDSRISPFYNTLEIFLPGQLPVCDFGSRIDYYIHFEREKPFRLYTAHVRCETDNGLIFQSRYRLMGIPDRIILRMAKEIIHPKHPLPGS